MRFLVTLLFLIVAPASAEHEDPGREISCYSGGTMILQARGTDVTLGQSQVSFADRVSGRRVWIHADCVVTWAPGRQP